MLANYNIMPSESPEISSATCTPKEFFEVVGIGFGDNLNHQALRDFVKKHGKKKAKRIIEGSRQQIEALTGFTPERLSDFSTHCSFPAKENCKTIRETIQKNLYKNLGFLGVYNDEGKESGLRRTALEANAYIEKLVAHYFPGNAGIKIEDEVQIRNDAAKLLLMAFDEHADSKLNFDAARKLLLMYYIGEIRNYSKKDEDNDKALEYMMDLLNERVVELPEDTKQGAKEVKYLISYHAKDTYATIDTEISDEVPEEACEDSMAQITPLSFRKTTVIDDEGEREIFFAVEPRQKLDESRLVKMLRYNAEVGQRDVDLNGLRFLFKKKEDWDAFFPMLREEIKNEVREGICERLEKEGDLDEDEKRKLQAKLNDLDSCVKVLEEPKNSLNGEGFNGNSASSSKKLKTYKFPLLVTRADGRQHRYEFQVFLPDGYADAEYRKGVSWEAYHADRFFREGIDHVMFPEHHYSELDHEEAHKKKMQQAHEKVWSRKKGLMQNMKSFFGSATGKVKSLLKN